MRQENLSRAAAGKTSLLPRRILTQSWMDSQARAAEENVLEREGETGANGALILREDEHCTIARDVWPIPLSE